MDTSKELLRNNKIRLSPAHRQGYPSFLRTSNGAEADLILERGNDRRLFEFKLSKAPKLSRGFYELVETLKPEAAMIIAPVDDPYEIRRGILVDTPDLHLSLLSGMKT